MPDFGAVILGSLLCSAVYLTRKRRTIEAHICLTGVSDQEWIDYFRSEKAHQILNEAFGMKEFSEGLRYHYTRHVMSSVQECVEMRERELLKDDNDAETSQEWSPVFIYDFSDDTILDRWKINQMVFHNQQLHMRRVLNKNNGKDHVRWAAPWMTRCLCKFMYPRIKFDFKFAEWKSDLQSQQITEEFCQNLEDRSGNLKWEFHTGKKILSALKGHYQYFGAKSAKSDHEFSKAVDQAFLSNDLALSKSFYAFDPEKKSGVIFIGEVHKHQPFLEMQRIVLESLTPWLSTLFTEFNECHFLSFISEIRLLYQINRAIKRNPGSELTICPMRDPTQSNYLASKPSGLPSTFQLASKLREDRFGSLPELKAQCDSAKFRDHYTSKMNFDDGEQVKSFRFEQQYCDFICQERCTDLIRSMVHFNSIAQELKPNQLAVVIQGGLHTLDIMAAMQGTCNTDLLFNANYIPDSQRLIALLKA